MERAQGHESPSAQPPPSGGSEDGESLVVRIPGGPRRIAGFIRVVCVLAVFIGGYQTFIGNAEKRVQTAEVKPEFAKPRRVQVEEWVHVRHPWALPVTALGALIALCFWAGSIKRGKAWAVLLGYVFCAIAVTWVVGFLAFVAVRTALPAWAAFSAWAVIAASVALATSQIVLSPDVRRWLQLNGKCPACRNWSFGVVAPSTNVTCAACGVHLRFRRAKAIVMGCPKCGARLQAPRSFKPDDVGVCPKCETEFELGANEAPEAV